MYDHLMRGVAKGAFTEEVAKQKFENWLNEKEGKIQGKKDNLASTKEKMAADALAAEAEVNAKRAAEIAAKNKPEEPAVEETTEEAPVAETEDATSEESVDSTEEKAAE